MLLFLCTNERVTIMTPVSQSIVDRIQSYFPPVEKLPLAVPHNGTIQETPHWGLFRTDNDKLESVGPAVGEGYELHTTDDICALVEASESVLGECADVQLGFRNGHHVSIQPDKSRRMIAYKNDSVIPRLLINATYGKTFNATIGLYRDACSNLQILRQVSGISVRIRHTSSLRLKMHDLIEDFKQIEHGVGNLQARIDQMVSRKTQLAEFLASMFPEPSAGASDRTRNQHVSKIRAIAQRIMNERVVTGNPDNDINTVSAWEAFQGVQGYIQHDVRRRGKVGDFDRAIMALDDTRVKQAEVLAMELSA